MSANPTLAAGKSPDSARILIIDFGGQYTQLIARRVREVGVYSEILPYDANPADIEAFGASGIVLSGGPESVAAADAPRVDPVVFESGVPILGICYGMQAIAAHFGGAVDAADHREFGFAEVELTGADPLLGGLAEGRPLKVWMSHGDRVERLPAGFEAIAATPSAPLAGFADRERNYYGVQFHPEVTHTEHGLEIIRRFAIDICGCPGDWTPANIIAEHIDRIRETVGNDRVLLGLSGGVDSSVVAALLHAAIGDQLICVFVDTGLLRLHEGDQVMEVFAEHLGVNVIRVDAEAQFLAKLEGVSDPEVKRKIIGHE
ncbi:MAG: glutamine-hydrolyzing GMP synthase, partial [Gammaproteobacteria bacterium]|nr:glutamine-hydrolyzing GMP synthase [Gammaproteobacteria bacterium]